MEKVRKRKFVQMWTFPLLAVILLLTAFMVDRESAAHALQITESSVLEMLGFLPPIFVLLGLFDVWTDRETVIRLMGSQSGVRGLFLAFMLGSLAAGPLYMAFPVAAVLLKKRAGLFQVFVFIGTWAIAKVPMLLFESSCFGFSYTSVRLVLNIVAIVGIAWLMTCLLTESDKEEIYRKADEDG